MWRGASAARARFAYSAPVSATFATGESKDSKQVSQHGSLDGALRDLVKARQRQEMGTYR